ncbi:GNAT family N-acetyltransferase [Winogradskya humida]|uniref:N-acetyltransferase domain-containing protein n=1 Tax=Winogradskya humida TaxID=113566 RepID=A0ABQ3ZPX5_9ACTN|nr:GNAT family N-acetyltransferase [Actinoplanes humidus]GIE20608.1 hypothetical protein Ahu01nite_037100 [Actinoplanes humidus]
MITPAHPTDVPRLLQIRHAAFSAQAPTAYSPGEVATLLADVDPAFTRQGIGSALLHWTEHDFSTRTAHSTIYAGVAMHARDFYLANGYVLDRQAVAWDGSAYLQMSKPLRQHG